MVVSSPDLDLDGRSFGLTIRRRHVGQVERRGIGVRPGHGRAEEPDHFGPKTAIAQRNPTRLGLLLHVDRKSFTTGIQDRLASFAQGTLGATLKKGPLLGILAGQLEDKKAAPQTLAIAHAKRSSADQGRRCWRNREA